MGLNLLFSCSTLKKKPAPVITSTYEHFQSILLEKKNRYKNLNIKTKVEMEVEGKKYSSPANIRMVKDSAIWISVTPFLGIEAVRALIRPDSIFVNNRLQGQSLKFNYDSLSKWLNAKVNYTFLESALSGEVPLNTITLVPLTSDSVFITCGIESTDLKGMSWINTSNYHLNRLKLTRANGNDSLLALYDDYRETEGLNFPFYSKISMFNKKMNFSIEAKHFKLEKDIPDLKLPFSQKE